jgi:hypothetical protein
MFSLLLSDSEFGDNVDYGDGNENNVDDLKIEEDLKNLNNYCK